MSTTTFSKKTRSTRNIFVHWNLISTQPSAVYFQKKYYFLPNLLRHRRLPPLLPPRRLPPRHVLVRRVFRKVDLWRHRCSFDLSSRHCSFGRSSSGDRTCRIRRRRSRENDTRLGLVRWNRHRDLNGSRIVNFPWNNLEWHLLLVIICSSELLSFTFQLVRRPFMTSRTWG